MALEFGVAVKVLEEHIEVLKQNLLFLMAECKSERKMTQIVTIKRELDKAVQERMKLRQIYSSHSNNNNLAVPVVSA
ncbi:MAG: hypothetical protein M3286_06170 [Thermoproteota archaeon]|nr:hypothetical protein [Thermoproteota archaeon]